MPGSDHPMPLVLVQRFVGGQQVHVHRPYEVGAQRRRGRHAHRSRRDSTPVAAGPPAVNQGDRRRTECQGRNRCEVSDRTPRRDEPGCALCPGIGQELWHPDQTLVEVAEEPGTLSKTGRGSPPGSRPSWPRTCVHGSEWCHTLPHRGQPSDTAPCRDAGRLLTPAGRRGGRCRAGGKMVLTGRVMVLVVDGGVCGSCR